MPFVLDASVVASWAFPDEGDQVAAQAFARLRVDQGFVPALWWFEARNALVVNERRGRIREADTKKFLFDISALPMVVVLTPDENGIFALARRHWLTFYDAAYLELASRLDAPLATLDKKLAAAALAENVPLLQAP